MVVDEGTLNIIVGLFVFFFGASIGSFLNVVAWRLPRGIPLMFPGSRCPSCQTPVPPHGLVPVFGWLFVLGRCRACGSRVSPHYPLMELLTGVLTLVVFFKFYSAPELVYALGGGGMLDDHLLGRYRYEALVPMFTSLWLLYSGVALSLIDLEHRILPNKITIPGTLVSFALASANPMVGWKAALIGFTLGAGLLFCVSKGYELFRKREGMGMGDVKYLGLIGAALGWQGVIWTIALASFVGMFYGLAVGLIQRQGLNVAIPFGPFLAIAAFLLSVWGPEIRAFLY